MTLRHDWRQAGTTGRAHLVARLPLLRPARGFRRASMSACGMVRLAAWVPEGEAVRCGLCRRLEQRAQARGTSLLEER